MTFLSVPNWDKYQHYRDRRPVWIKVYVELLDDEAYALTDRQFGQLVKLWLLAGRTNNRIPDNPVYISHMIGSEVDELDLDVLIDKRYLRRTKSARRKQDKWPSRYIPRKLREQVLARDQWRCVQCSASLWLEIDHVVPVSGGGHATLDNLQTLCRSCNRAKRAKVNADLRSNQSSRVRSPEVRTRERREELERTGEPPAQKPPSKLRCPDCELPPPHHVDGCPRAKAAGVA